MKTIQVRIPNTLYLQIEELVKEGWFGSKDSITEQALYRFFQNHRPAVIKRHILEDVEQALGGKRPGTPTRNEL